MPTIEDATTELRTTCPLCEAPLDPIHPNECPKCDWVLGYRRQAAQRAGTLRDRIAVVLSVVPGLGHYYKGHRLSGALLILGAIFAVAGCAVIATASMGLGLVLIPAYWIGVMLQAYFAEDRGA